MSKYIRDPLIRLMYFDEDLSPDPVYAEATFNRDLIDSEGLEKVLQVIIKNLHKKIERHLLE